MAGADHPRRVRLEHGVGSPIAAQRSAPARFLEGRVGYAIGDVHGRADLLAQILIHLERELSNDQRPAGAPVLIFLGDYVDRGPQSRQVIEILVRLRQSGPWPIVCLRGNHEEAMAGFLDDPLENRAWLTYGGDATLRSYGVKYDMKRAKAQDPDAIVGLAQDLRAALPASHRQFLDNLRDHVVLGDYCFVHAGIDPGKSLADQQSRDLLWIRNRFLLDPRPWSHRVVHGHTPTQAPFADGRRINVDTGAYASGRLSAVRLEGDAHRFVTIAAKQRGQ